MTGDATAVLRDALALAEDERATIAAELIASLPSPGAEDADQSAWLRDVTRRARAVLNREVESEEWEVVERRILHKLSGE